MRARSARLRDAPNRGDKPTHRARPANTRANKKTGDQRDRAASPELRDCEKQPAITKTTESGVDAPPNESDRQSTVRIGPAGARRRPASPEANRTWIVHDARRRGHRTDSSSEPTRTQMTGADFSKKTRGPPNLDKALAHRQRRSAARWRNRAEGPRSYSPARQCRAEPAAGREPVKSRPSRRDWMTTHCEIEATAKTSAAAETATEPRGREPTSEPTRDSNGKDRVEPLASFFQNSLFDIRAVGWDAFS